MHQNQHPIDRTLRIVVGLFITSLAFYGPRTDWALLGLVPLITGLIGFCPLYRILGVSTCRVPGRRSDAHP